MPVGIRGHLGPVYGSKPIRLRRRKRSVRTNRVIGYVTLGVLWLGLFGVAWWAAILLLCVVACIVTVKRVRR